MAFGDLYRVGTISVAAGGTTVTGAGTLWAAGVTQLMAGDTLNAGGQLAIIKSVDSSTSLTMATPWTGSALAGAAYAVQMDSPKRFTTKALAENTARLVERSMRLDRAVDTFRCQGVFAGAPPAGPLEGDTYLLGNVPSGAWAGYAGQFASWTGTGWAFTAAEEGDQAFSTPDGVFYVRHGGAWLPTAPTLGRGGNLVVNSDASAGTARISPTLGANTSFGTILGLAQGDWVPDGIDGFGLVQGTGATDNYSWFEIRQSSAGRFNVQPGKYYEYSAYTVNRLCSDVFIDIIFYGANGAQIGSADCFGTGAVAFSGSNAASAGAGGKSMADAKRLWFICRAPDGAAFATPRFVKSGATASVSSCVALAWRPFFAEARATQTEPTPWSVGPLLAVSPGLVADFARSTPPQGWLKANGALVSRTAYADLFGAIGTTFGVGDGATTFALPDLRGEFRRGWDDGRGADGGRLFGSWQNHAFQDHQHNAMWSGGGSGGAPGFLIGDRYALDGSQFIYGASTGNAGTETRPRNLALLPCIKF